MKELKSFTTGKGTYDSFPDKTARSELPKKLTRPATAQAGDYLRIKAIGADGSMEVEAGPAPEGGSSGSSVAYPDWSHLKWHIIGDSLTDRNNNHTVNRYYDFIAQATGIQLSLDGIGGTGYGAGVSTNQHFVERVKNIPDDADIVTIFGSANDIKYAEGANSEIFHALSWITLNRPGLRVIVVPPAPVKWFTRSSDEWVAYGDRLKLCANKCLHRYVEDMYDCPPFDPNNEQHMAVFFTTDPEGIHPNEAGHKAMAPIIYNALLQELELENGYPRGGADGDGDGQNPSQDGFSPIATVTQTADGATISITDKNGTTTATVTNGRDGQNGEDGRTPTKGVDYFTPADVQEIAEQAAELIEVPEGGGGAAWEIVAKSGAFTDVTMIELDCDFSKYREFGIALNLSASKDQSSVCACIVKNGKYEAITAGIGVRQIGPRPGWIYINVDAGICFYANRTDWTVSPVNVISAPNAGAYMSGLAETKIVIMAVDSGNGTNVPSTENTISGEVVIKGVRK